MRRKPTENDFYPGQIVDLDEGRFTSGAKLIIREVVKEHKGLKCEALGGPYDGEEIWLKMSDITFYEAS